MGGCYVTSACHTRPVLPLRTYSPARCRGSGVRACRSELAGAVHGGAWRPLRREAPALQGFGG